MKIAIFYHCLFAHGEPPAFSDTAFSIVAEQMQHLRDTGLLEAASHFCVGLNGDDDSSVVAGIVIPEKAQIVLHGPQCRNECRSIRMIEEWLPGHEDWYVLYFHAKGCTRAPSDPLGWLWRACMTRHVVTNWRQCMADLDAGFEAVGCHWMQPPATPPGQFIFAGTFFWTTGKFLATLPSIMERERIKVSGLDSIESRYEAEVWLGNGPRPPRIKDYHGPGWNPSKINTCL